MPNTTPKIQAQLGVSGDAVSYATADQWGTLPADAEITKGEILFPRIDVDKEIAALIEIIGDTSGKAAPAEEVKSEKKDAKQPEGVVTMEQISIDDFFKVDLRVAKIEACEPVKKSKKLLKLTLNDGTGTRTVASGISQFYQPEELVGKSVILVANLKPAKLCGIESQGMVLAATCGENDVRVIFVGGMPEGSKIS